MKYTLNDAIRSIHELAELTGGDVDSRKYRRHKLKPSLSYMLRHFGTWNFVVRKAGFIPKRNREDHELIQRFRETVEKLGYVPTSKEYGELGLSPSCALFYERGYTWEDMLEEAGLTKKPAAPKFPEQPEEFVVRCQICGTPTKQTTYLHPTKLYCSEGCKKKAWEIRRSERLKNHLCVVCGKPNASKWKTCEVCREKNRKSKRRD